MFKFIIFIILPVLSFGQFTQDSLLITLQKYRNGSTKLRINDTINKAALLHAEWLMEGNGSRRGHIQENPLLKEPKNRIEFFNKKEPKLIGEICLVGKDILNKSVDSLILYFKDSPTHWYAIQEYGNSRSILEIGFGFLEKNNRTCLVILFCSIDY